MRASENAIGCTKNRIRFGFLHALKQRVSEIHLSESISDCNVDIKILLGAGCTRAEGEERYVYVTGGERVKKTFRAPTRVEVLETVPKSFACIHVLKHQLELETLSFGRQLAGLPCGNSRGVYSGKVGANQRLAYRVTSNCREVSLRRYHRKKVVCPRCGRELACNSVSKHRRVCEQLKEPVSLHGRGPIVERHKLLSDPLVVSASCESDPSRQAPSD